MIELKRVNNNSIFECKTPILFDYFEGDGAYDLDATRRGGYYNMKLPEIFSLNEDSSIAYNLYRKHKGLLFRMSTSVGIICIAVKDELGKISIYCNEVYFNMNPARKKHVNTYAKSLELSVRKDIYYVSMSDINSWIKQIEVDLSFYSKEKQAETTTNFFNKMKESYPKLEEIDNGGLVELTPTLINGVNGFA